MYTPTPKYRKQLNTNQIQVLKLLFKFRFGSGELLAQSMGKQRSTDIYRRLRILEDQELIAKRYEPSYKLRGRPAAYYLLPAGARAFQVSYDKPISIKVIYKDSIRTEQFIDHCLAVFAANNQLRTRYGDKLAFFTKSQLSGYDYFPEHLPDAYIRLKTSGRDHEFFFDIFHDSQPFFTTIRRIKQHIEYAESGDWLTTKTDLPKILIVCDSTSLQKRLRKRIERLMSEYYDDDLVSH